MNFRSGLLAALLYIKACKDITPEFTPNYEDTPEFEERYLDLPDYVMQVKLTEEGFVTDPSNYILPPNTLEIYQRLMSTATWFSAVTKHFNEEEWVLIICSDDPVQVFQRRARMKELKFKILRRNP